MMTMFRRLAELAMPIAGYISNGSNVVHAVYSVRDHTQNVKRTISKVLVAKSGEVLGSISQDVTADIVGSAFSPSGRLKAILREVAAGDSKKRFVEIWKDHRVEVSAEVTSTHGSFCADDYLASLAFSPSESAIVYTAEANPPSKETSNIERFRFTPSFGEGLPTRKRPTTFLCQWRDASGKPLASPVFRALSLANPLPVPVLFGQAAFASEDKLIATGYEFTDDARLLGVRGCFNRPSSILQLDIPSPLDAKDEDTTELACTVAKISPADLSSRSPRIFSSNLVFWLSSKLGGAHAACSSLHSLDLNSGERRVIVDTVWEPQGEDSFPGLFLDFLPQQPFLEIAGRLYITCYPIWHSRATILLIDTQDGGITDLTPDSGELFSWIVLGTDSKSRILCSRSSPTLPHEVVLLELDTQDVRTPPSVVVLDKPELDPEITAALSKLSVSVIPIPQRYPTETIVYQSTEHHDIPPPTITIVHGGPHATTTTSFSAGTVALALEGYTLSLPNYTGSLGFGEKFVQAVIGNCGSLDVEDCMASVNHLVELGISQMGSGKQFIQGGSHGGFLGAHLIGQYPEVFSAAVLRNPVISVGELSISDIPDWYYAEFALPFTPTSLITPEVYKQLYSASPIAHVDAVKAKVLLLIGGSDLRVAPTQGIGYYHALKGRGKEVEMLWFEKEGHPLDGVEAMRVGWEVALEWFKGRHV